MVVFSLFDCGSAVCANGLPPWPRPDAKMRSSGRFGAWPWPVLVTKDGANIVVDKPPPRRCDTVATHWPSRLDDEKFSNADFQQVKLAKSVLAIEWLAYATTKFDDFIWEKSSRRLAILFAGSSKQSVDEYVRIPIKWNCRLLVGGGG